ncbi:MAG: hypothetical protein H7318_12650 [Oligoflexus sp.]|nr:hypothetical protein [Oligoflexus sp.]
MSLTHTHAKESDWDILFTENADGLQVRVKQNRKDGVAISKTYEFPTYGQVLPHLTGRILPLAMSRLLIESLPFGMAFKVNGKSVFFPRSNDLPPHSKELIVYGLRFDEKSQLWMPKIYAYLKRLEPLDGDKAIQGDEYEWTENRKPLEKNKIYWAQDSQGLGQRSADYEVVINKLLHKSAGSGSNFMSQIFFESFRSSYTGIRFGKSLLGSGSIVTEGNLVSGLVEIRGGPLTGLRSYYDIVPLVSRNEGSEEEHFSLKRASIGWCFSALMPKSYRFLLSSVDVQPKLGLLDIDSRFRINPEESDSALSFKAKNIYDLALEFGIERSSLYYRTRLWASIDAAPSVLSAKQGLSVLSTRAGLDSYINIFESRGGGNVNILAFALAENLALTKERVNANEDEDLAVSKLKFQLFFVGLGFTVSW